ncbi:MAG: two-component regulator propeller domain-containing protein, partial [Bacteroidota bacterium]
RLYPSPDETVIRTVLAHEGRVYTGSYMNFGYWERDSLGTLNYRQLSHKVQDQLIPDEHFWNIVPFEGFLIFQSLQQLFLFQPTSGEIEVIRPENSIAKLFATKESLFFTDHNAHLFKLSAGKITPMLSTKAAPESVVLVWEEGPRLIIQTAANGCFALENDSLIPLPRHAFLRGKRIYSALKRREGGFAFGTISNGVYIVDREGTLQYHLEQTNGLANNTVLSLYEDAHRNIWAGTDNGISYLNLSSPFRKFTLQSGRLGTVYASILYQGRLYLGSNQGLFVKAAGSQEELRLIPGTRGQVWTLHEHNGQLFCGHNEGAFLVDKEQVLPVTSGIGTWLFLPIPDRPDLLLQGNYDGLAVIKKSASGWHLRNKVKGFDFSARFAALLPGPEVYVSHEYRGVYGLRLDADYRKVTERHDYPTPAKGKNAGLTAFEGDAYYYSREGIFRLKNFIEGFIPAEDLSSALSPADYISGHLTNDAKRLWFFTRRNFGYFQRGTLNNNFQANFIPATEASINARTGYENITSIGGDTLLIGTADGYLLLALPAITHTSHELHFTRIFTEARNQMSRRLPLIGNVEIPYAANNLRFNFSVPSYDRYFSPEFQHRLVGLQEDWSPWSTQASLVYPNLPYGVYTLEVRSRLGLHTSENTLTYRFTVLRPWYATYLAFGLYCLGSLLVGYLFHRGYTQYYRRKQRLLETKNERKIAAQQREAELALSKLTNQQLQADIDNKNREMAISTMNLVKKNELLQLIKENLLAKQDPVKNIKEVVATIDKNIDEAETWQLFKEAFENADRDFFKKIKEVHPELTPNDLKLCAYLRLNLSSKEIAPMLNISVRSVEVKRYRLRKKMGLEHEAGLVEYILGL